MHGIGEALVGRPVLSTGAAVTTEVVLIVPVTRKLAQSFSIALSPILEEDLHLPDGSCGCVRLFIPDPQQWGYIHCLRFYCADHCVIA